MIFMGRFCRNVNYFKQRENIPYSYRLSTGMLKKKEKRFQKFSRLKITYRRLLQQPSICWLYLKLQMLLMDWYWYPKFGFPPDLLFATKLWRIHFLHTFKTVIIALLYICTTKQEISKTETISTFRCSVSNPKWGTNSEPWYFTISRS